MKYPKVQYELDLNAKYACRFFEKNGFDYKIKRQSYEGDTFELRKDGITFSVKVPSNPKLNKKKYFEQLVQYFENVKDCVASLSIITLFPFFFSSLALAFASSLVSKK